MKSAGSGGPIDAALTSTAVMTWVASRWLTRSMTTGCEEIRPTMAT
jgi:hypothetical protein